MKIIKKVLLIFIGIILSFVILEIGLQIAGFSITTIKKYKNKITKDPNTITILCLGESTTDNQWPPILQKILDEKSKNKKFNVIDKGACAQKTSFIVNNIEQWIRNYKINIVITMMGINDWKVLPWAKHEYNIFEKFFSSVKLYKLICYIIDCIKSKKVYKNLNIPDFDSNTLHQYSKIYSQNKKIAKEDFLKVKNFHKSLKNLFNANKSKYYHYQLFSNFEDIDYSELYKILLNSDNETDNELIFNSEMFVHTDSKIPKIKKSEYTDILLGGFAIKYLEDKNFEIAKKYFQQAENYRLKHFNFFTQKNYFKIIDICMRNNIKLIAMQYPNRSLRSLQNTLKKNLYYSDIIFVDNENIFKTPLLSGKPYNDFFRDQFAGDFGHCTDLGNTLIAENVAETILKLYN